MDLLGLEVGQLLDLAPPVPATPEPLFAFFAMLLAWHQIVGVEVLLVLGLRDVATRGQAHRHIRTSQPSAFLPGSPMPLKVIP